MPWELIIIGVGGEANIKILLVLVFLFLFLLFDLSSLIKKIAKFPYSNLLLTIAVFLILVLKIVRVTGVGIVAPSFLLISFLLWAFLLAFSFERKILYSLGFVFLVLSPVLHLLHFSMVAQITVNTAMAFISTGVLKDLFYEKIFTP